MSGGDYLALAAVALLAALALRACLKKGGGCGGDCAHCGGCKNRK